MRKRTDPTTGPGPLRPGAAGGRLARGQREEHQDAHQKEQCAEGHQEAAVADDDGQVRAARGPLKLTPNHCRGARLAASQGVPEPPEGEPVPGDFAGVPFAR